MDKLNLREARIKADLTLKEVAITVGVSLNTISRWERGVGKPNYAELVFLASMYGLSVDDIFLP